MIPALRSEVRKLLTVRSTYILLALCAALTVFFAFFIEGFNQKADIMRPDLLASEVTSAAQALSLFIALAGLLLVTHEYRHNTIAYTLTATRSRTQVLVAKTIVISLFAVVVTVVFSAAAPYLTRLGLHMKGLEMVPQALPLLSLLARAAFYGWAYSMIVMITAFIVRNQVGTLAFILLFPSVGEQLLGLLLKENAKYMPFTALGQVVFSGQQAAGAIPSGTILSHAQAAQVVLAYIIAGWLIAWVLFRKRDAN